MAKGKLLAAILISIRLSAAAAVADSSVTIVSAKTTIEFIWNVKLARVEVSQKDIVNYLSNSYNNTVPYSEFFDDHTRIDAVNCRIDGKMAKDFSPQVANYSAEGIFYSDAKVCWFPVHLTQKGSTATVSIEKTIDDPKYFTSIFFPESYKVLSKEVLIKVPRWMKAEFKELNFTTGNIAKDVVYDAKNDADLITYRIKNLAATAQENQAPGPTYIFPHLLALSKSASPQGSNITYFNTLADQYAWYHSLVKDLENDRTALKAKAEELTAGLTNDIEKAKAIFYWVQNNIRYIAFENGLAGFKPDKADEVLRKKYGDCKGMANLTKNLLTALGFDARLCWLGTQHIAYNYETPSMAVDNHMICALLYKNSTYYLDATETYLPFNEYAERIQGRQVLVEDGEKYILNKIPLAKPGQNLDHQKTMLTIAGGTLSGTADHIWKGEEREQMLSQINALKKDASENALIKYFSDGNQNTVQKLTVNNLDKPDLDLLISYSIDQKKGFSSFGKDYYIELDLGKELNDFKVDTAERQYDYWFPYKMNVQRETYLALPENYKIESLPTELNINTPEYEFKISYLLEGTKLTYKKSLQLKTAKLPRSKFSAWNADISKLNAYYNEALVLKPKS